MSHLKGALRQGLLFLAGTTLFLAVACSTESIRQTTAEEKAAFDRFDKGTPRESVLALFGKPDQAYPLSVPSVFLPNDKLCAANAKEVIAYRRLPSGYLFYFSEKGLLECKETGTLIEVVK